MTTENKSSSEPTLVTLNPIYRVDQAAHVLNCTKESLIAKFRKGKIKAGKKFRQWYTTHNDLVEFIHS